MLGLKVNIKKNVIILRKDNCLIFKGPLGCLMLTIPVNLLVKKSKVDLFIVAEDKVDKSILYTFRTLIYKKMLGVSRGFFVILDIKGIGWQVVLENSRVLIFKLGFTNLVKYYLPPLVEAFIINKQKLKIFSMDLDKVSQVTAILCNLRKVDVYKGKGILKQGLKLQLKLSSKFK